MTNITRKQADDLVDDLVFAYRDQDVTFPNSRSYLEEYYAQRERVVTALLTGAIPVANGIRSTVNPSQDQ